ncbi:hypothetical protein DPMN_131359 [Dreissena polymorpha]|uniref:Uncharacterized protein n=1 Tax=Dreissena polymorpha TaxID=45954 RepID=A0A9D4H8E8_DREPO|nr:hypothetical protein DPMN_131359 [Dreissena polymorpha]
MFTIFRVPACALLRRPRGRCQRDGPAVRPRREPTRDLGLGQPEGGLQLSLRPLVYERPRLTPLHMLRLLGSVVSRTGMVGCRPRFCHEPRRTQRIARPVPGARGLDPLRGSVATSQTRSRTGPRRASRGPPRPSSVQRRVHLRRAVRSAIGYRITATLPPGLLTATEPVVAFR